MDSQHKPAFSVIIPTYNRAGKLKNCLQAIVQQTFRDFEVLVCDDGSKDDTGDVVKEFEGSDLCIRYLYNENSGGPATPRNAGIQQARADWVCFLDSDDSWYPNKLEVCSKFTNDFDFICHDLDILKNDTVVGKMITRQPAGDVFADLMTLGSRINTSSVCARKELVLKHGGFSTAKELVAVEDFDLWLKIAQNGARFKIVNESLGIYCAGDDSISATGDKYIASLTAVFNKHIPSLQGKKYRQQSSAFLNYHIAVLEEKMGRYADARRHYKVAFGDGKTLIKLKAFLKLLVTSTK